MRALSTTLSMLCTRAKYKTRMADQTAAYNVWVKAEAVMSICQSAAAFGLINNSAQASECAWCHLPLGVVPETKDQSEFWHGTNVPKDQFLNTYHAPACGHEFHECCARKVIRETFKDLRVWQGKQDYNLKTKGVICAATRCKERWPPKDVKALTPWWLWVLPGPESKRQPKPKFLTQLQQSIIRQGHAQAQQVAWD
jgi:hypothetical protein